MKLNIPVPMEPDVAAYFALPQIHEPDPAVTNHPEVVTVSLAALDGPAGRKLQLSEVP